jgi:epoxide hydrolase
MLTIVSIYWLTNTAGSSAHFYYEGREAVALAATGAPPPPISVPVGVSVFPRDIFLPLQRLAHRDIATITHWTEHSQGGHFAALEQPGQLTEDIRIFARSLR